MDIVIIDYLYNNIHLLWVKLNYGKNTELLAVLTFIIRFLLLINGGTPLA